MILELGRRHPPLAERPAAEAPCELCRTRLAPWTGHGNFCQPCRDETVRKVQNRIGPR